MSPTPPKLLIADVVAHFGTQAALAAFLEVTPQALQRWAGPFVPPLHAIALIARMPALKQYIKPEDWEPPAPEGSADVEAP